MLNNHIDDCEYLYRRVITNPNFWDFEKNQPSSAVFKDSHGTSVDRQADRSDDDIIKSFTSNFSLRAIIKIQTKTCRSLETYPIYKPENNNIYHCEIHDSESKVQISSSKAKKLRDNSEIIFKNEDIDR